MIGYLFTAAVAVALVWALARLRRDDGATRRLRRSEYEPLVRHIYYQ